MLIEIIIKQKFRNDPLRLVIALDYYLENSKTKFNWLAMQNAMKKATAQLKQQKSSSFFDHDDDDYRAMADMLKTFNPTKGNADEYKRDLTLMSTKDLDGQGDNNEEKRGKRLSNFKERDVMRYVALPSCWVLVYSLLFDVLIAHDDLSR